MNFPWFKRVGLIFLPIKRMGWIIVLAALAYAVFVFIDIDSRSHSVSDTLMNFVFNLIIIFGIYSLFALLTSWPTKKR